MKSNILSYIIFISYINTINYNIILIIIIYIGTELPGIYRILLVWIYTWSTKSYITICNVTLDNIIHKDIFL